MQETSRNMVFISHASEDSHFAKWLALQLARSGYGIWCDLTKLLGGENWPDEINEALLQKTCKFLFLLSRNSNKKLDPLNELEVARSVSKNIVTKNFIIPIKIDDIPFDEADFRLRSYQMIVVENEWAHGLQKILKVLHEDKVPKHISFTPLAVCDWWKCNITGTQTLLYTPEILQSNRFHLSHFPAIVYAHAFNGSPIIVGDFPVPFFLYKNYLITFSTIEELDPKLSSQLRITASHAIEVKNLWDGKDPTFATVNQGQYIMSRLMNQAFYKGIGLLGYRTFALSNARCIYFDRSKFRHKKIIYTNNGELSSRITLWGNHHENTWYFGIIGHFVSLPFPHYCIRTTVLLQTKSELRAAPKSVFKSWYNKTWRNRLRAAMLHLSGGQNELTFNVGPFKEIRIKSLSEEYTSPISYKEPFANETLNDD